MMPEQKKELMRNSLEMQVQEWNRLWKQLQAGDRKTIKKVIDTFVGFVKGNMTVAEATFVVMYFLYMAIIRNGLVSMGSPWDIVIQACSFLIVIIFTSKKSTVRIISKIWDIVWSDSSDWENKINKIEHIIKMTAHQFFYVDVVKGEKVEREGD